MITFIKEQMGFLTLGFYTYQLVSVNGVAFPQRDKTDSAHESRGDTAHCTDHRWCLCPTCNDREVAHNKGVGEALAFYPSKGPDWQQIQIVT